MGVTRDEDEAIYEVGKSNGKSFRLTLKDEPTRESREDYCDDMVWGRCDRVRWCCC